MYYTATEAVKLVMSATGKNQQSMATEIGVSLRSLNQWMKHADKYPDKANQDKIIRAFPRLTRDDICGPVPK